MKKHLFYLIISGLIFSCSDTEEETIVEVPTSVPQVQVSLNSSAMMTTESDEQVIIISTEIAESLTEDTQINLDFSGSAELGSDYIVSSETIIIAAGSQIGTAEITIVNDGVFESGVENIIVSLGSVPDNITLGGNDGAVQIDITDGAAIVAFAQSTLTLEETSFFELDVILSKQLNEDIVIRYTSETLNNGYGVTGNELIIPAGAVSGTINIDLNDFLITADELKMLNVAITTVENDDVAIGTSGTIEIITTEVNQGLLITASWPSGGDLFDLDIFNAVGGVNIGAVTSSASGISGTEDIFLDDLPNPLPDGSYTIALRNFSFTSTSPSEIVTFDFLDEQDNTFGGPYTFTVNMDPTNRRINVFTLAVADGEYTVTQTSTEN